MPAKKTSTHSQPNRASTKRQASALGRSVRALYDSPLASERTGALYNAFSYPTKISPEAIAVFIGTHTAPGAVVLDTFAGSGTTGLAALLCDRPTPSMLSLAKKMGVTPNWGPRTAHLCEIGTLGAFISETLCSPPDPMQFAAAVRMLREKAEQKLDWIYEACDIDGHRGRIRHIIWSEVIICPRCQHPKEFWDAAVSIRPLAIRDSFTCEACGATSRTDQCKRAVETVPDDFGGRITRRKRVPVRICGATGSKKWSRAPELSDLTLIKRIAKAPLPSSAPDALLKWGDLHRAGYHTGIEKLHHFYTRRNFMAISTLWELVEECDAACRSALRLLILSYNSTHSTLMTRVVVKKGQPDFVLTGSQSGVLYVSGLPVEKNVIEGIARKAKSFIGAFSLVQGSRSKVFVHNTSSEKLPLRAASVDYVFTDPPFGGYIPYAEANQVNELWLDRTTNRAAEIIVSPAQGKTVDRYARMMGSVFCEISRVLKPDALATVVFHSAHAEVWKALTSAYAGAGLSVRATSVLDKIQASFKQVVSEVAVKGDPLLLLSKKAARRGRSAEATQIADEVIARAYLLEPSERDPQRLYSRFVGACLAQGVEVALDAREFYQRANRKTEGSK